MTKPIRLSWLQCVLFLAFVSFQIDTKAELPLQAIHGGVTVLPLTELEDVSAVRFEDKSQLMFKDYAVIAVPLFTEPGEYAVEVVHSSNQTTRRSIQVIDKQYPEEHITIADREQVSPSQANLDRIAQESKIMRTAYDLFSDHPDDLLPIVQPIEGRNSGVFGSRRFFNGEPRNPHSGIDWAAPTGTPIKNPTAGTVAVTGNFFFNGNTVMVDHGGGFISMMCHLDEIRVVEGQRVARGEILGTVGTTGRSTGPHLHWTISLGGVRTDPAVFMEQLNRLAP